MDMSLVCLLLTLLSSVACIAMPKMLYLVLTPQAKRNAIGH